MKATLKEYDEARKPFRVGVDCPRPEIAQDVRFSGHRILHEGAPMRKKSMESKVDVLTAQLEELSLIMRKK